jgi:hypothetical protein
MFGRILVACDGSTESGPGYETNNVSFNPLRRAHRVRDRARKVRSVDCGGSCDRAPYCGTSRDEPYALDVNSKKHDHNTSTFRG